MTPEEWAKDILEREEGNFRLVDIPESSVRYFAMNAAKNTIAELEMRRCEIFKADDPEYQEEYWKLVKSEIEKL